jgi:DNA-binding CsgD family transcriptional regulator
MTDESGNSGDIKAPAPDLQSAIKSVEDALKRVPERSPLHRQLEGALQVLRGEPIRKVAEVSEFSRRSIQRWLPTVPNDNGPASCLRVAKRGRTARLSAPQLTRLKDEVTERHREFDLPGENWTGRVLANHLSSDYGVALGTRQCRNLLRQLGVSRVNAAKPNQQSRSQSLSPGQTAPPPLSRSSAFIPSDWERKRRALRKIQRLASSGLPLVPFAHALFDISAEAIDQSDIHRIGERFGFWFARNFDIEKWSGIYKQVVMDTAGRSGFVSLDSFYKSAKPTAGFFVPAGGRHPDFISAQFFLPDFMRSSAWNEFFRPAGIDGALLNVLRDRGEIVGLYPLHRDGHMRTWGNTDIDFLRMAVPHIAHGFKAARQVGYSCNESDVFLPFDGTSQAIILTTIDGRVLALSHPARSIFQQIGIFDRQPADPLSARSMRAGLDYIARILRTVFFAPEGSPSELDSPVVRIFAHASGLVLKLRGFLTNGDCAHRYFTVIVEQGETGEHHLQRLMYRHGLSRREAELLLRLKGATLTYQEIATAMGVSKETVKTYFKRIAEKLDLHGRTELARRILGEN